MKKKSITIDDLAVMVQKGFAGVDNRFDAVDKRFDRIENRLDRIEKITLVNHEERIDKLETDMKKVKKDLFV